MAQNFCSYLLTTDSTLMWPKRRILPRGPVLGRPAFGITPFARFQTAQRWRSWSNPFKKLSPASKYPQVVIEEPDDDSALIADLKHYIKTTDVPHKLRTSILTAKLTELIETTDDFEFIIPTVNAVFMELLQLNNEQLQDVVPLETLFKLFTKSATTVLAQQAPLPEFMSVLTRAFVKDIVVPPSILVYVVELASLTNRNYLFRSIKMLIETKRTSPEFFTALLQYYEETGSLDLNKYETITYACREQDVVLGDEFYSKLIAFVESIYAQEPPVVHEYKNNERNLQRVQHLLSSNVSQVLSFKQVSSGTLIKLAKLSYELQSAFPDEGLEAFIKSIFDSMDETASKGICEELFRQNLGDETLAELLLAMAWSSKYNCSKSLLECITKYITSDDVKFSSPLIFQCKVYSLEEQDELQVFELLKSAITEFSQHKNNVDYNDLYTRIIQSLMITGIVTPRGPCIQLLTGFFAESFPTENTVYAYKHRLDAAIEQQDYITAVNIFDDSLQDTFQWSTTHDPTVQSTLNNLIVLICMKMSDINAIFPIFTKIKQQMVTQCNIHSIKALAPRMLQAEYVGDLIEMMKRELPKISKESNLKLPSNTPFGAHYRQLFDTLHSFVISYNNEETHETNWVLYGELHKYFYVPFESYLPALQFFCSKDRLNASLVIFRQVKMLSELHGQAQFLPPSRDMYMYLFGVYGDKLYEDGVKEIHEYLKMDVALPKQDIALQNCILNAYSNLQDVPKARDLFLAMSSNPKLIGGINEETVQIMIKTYTYSDFMYVKEFWNNLSHFGIVPNYPIFKQYLIAHVYHGLAEEAIDLTEEMKDYGIEFSSDTLMSMYNLSADQKSQKLISTWAKEKYPLEWTEVLNSGLLKSATGYEPDTNIIAGQISL